MKKTVLFTVVVTAVITAFMSMSFGHFWQRQIRMTKVARGEYCREINSLVKHIEFEKGEISGEKIILFDYVGNPVYSCSFETENKELLYFYKQDDGNVFYVFSRVADDESGVVFFNAGGETDGIGKLERLGGNCFYYDSYCELYCFG